MKQILEALAQHLLIPSYVQTAKAIVEARLDEFEAMVLARFAADSTARPEREDDVRWKNLNDEPEYERNRTYPESGGFPGSIRNSR